LELFGSFIQAFITSIFLGNHFSGNKVFGSKFQYWRGLDYFLSLSSKAPIGFRRNYWGAFNLRVRIIPGMVYKRLPKTSWITRFFVGILWEIFPYFRASSQNSLFQIFTPLFPLGVR